MAEALSHVEPRISQQHLFFQAENSIRNYKVTGVQTCALPILSPGEQNRGADSSATGGDCLSTSCGGREKDAPRYNGNGSEHSLSNRQQSVGGWDAGADPDQDRKSVV